MNIIIDIDGTLSDPEHRRHYLEGENNNWEKFFKEVDSDPVNMWCGAIVNKFYNTHNVYLVTARPEISKSGINIREKTENWLTVNDVSYDELIMREEGDFRQDTVVKQEILDEKLPEPELISFAIDDRKDVADMWRKNGITCLHCSDVEGY